MISLGQFSSGAHLKISQWLIDRSVTFPLKMITEQQKVLLESDHTPRPHHSNVGYRICCFESVIFHHVECNQRSCTSQTCSITQTSISQVLYRWNKDILCLKAVSVHHTLQSGDIDVSGIVCLKMNTSQSWKRLTANVYSLIRCVNDSEHWYKCTSLGSAGNFCNLSFKFGSTKDWALNDTRHTNAHLSVGSAGNFGRQSELQVCRWIN